MEDDMALEKLREKMTLLSSFLDKKIDEKDISIRELAEETGLSRSYIYLLISENRDTTPADDAIEKLAKALDLTDKDKDYLLDIAKRERESGKLIYDDSPEPEPEPPVKPEPSPDITPWYKNKTVIAVMVVVFIAGLLLGCCGSSAILPGILEAIHMQDMQYW